MMMTMFVVRLVVFYHILSIIHGRHIPTNDARTPSSKTTTATSETSIVTKTTSTVTPTVMPSEKRNTALKDECMLMHKHFRALHTDTKELKWDFHLQDSAQERANELLASDSRKVKNQHSTDEDIGENVLRYTGVDDTLLGKCTIAVYLWSTESSRYDIASQTSSGETSNFTQMVWKGTKRVGFGVAKKGNRFVVVAHYYPRGNIEGRFKENVTPLKFRRTIFD